MVGGAICTDTLSIIVVIVSGFLAQINFKSSEVRVYLSSSYNRKTHISISVAVY